MDETTFQRKLTELVNSLEGLSPEHRSELEALIADRKVSQSELFKKVKTLVDSLDTLRLNIRYMIFDNEASRREFESWIAELTDINQELAFENQRLRKRLSELGGQ